MRSVPFAIVDDRPDMSPNFKARLGLEGLGIDSVDSRYAVRAILSNGNPRGPVTLVQVCPESVSLRIQQFLFSWRASYSQRMDRVYFERYCGEGSYDENYLHHSGIEHSIEICDHFGLSIESVLVLGAATGRVLKHFEDRWGVRAYGCEISRWAHARIPPRYHRRIARADMRRHVLELVRKGRTFDLVFSNSLIYLEAGEIPNFLAICSRLGGHFHFYSSTSESFESNDPYRVTLRPHSWWRDAFLSNGFAPTRSRYLWRSRYC